MKTIASKLACLISACVFASGCASTRAVESGSTVCRSGDVLDASIGEVSLCSDFGNNRQSVMLATPGRNSRELARLVLPDYAETTLTVFDKSAGLFLVQDELMEVDAEEIAFSWAIVSTRKGLVGQLHSKTLPKVLPIEGGWIIQWIDASGRQLDARLCARGSAGLESVVEGACP